MGKALKGIAAASLVLTLICSNPAFADWQYTKWGMTVDQVKAAGGARIKPLQAGTGNQSYQDSAALLAASYSAAPYDFQVIFNFAKATGALNHVQLILRDIKKCSDLRDDLLAKYGAAKDKSLKDIGLEVLEWQDTALKNNLVFAGDLTKGGAYEKCSVQYRPLPGAGL